MRKSSLIPLPRACRYWKARCRESLHGGFGEGRMEKARKGPRQPPIPLGKGVTEKAREGPRRYPTSFGEGRLAIERKSVLRQFSSCLHLVLLSESEAKTPK